MKLTTEQASALLAAEPFVVVRVMFDAEGYLDHDFEVIHVATNAWWDDTELWKFVKDHFNHLDEVDKSWHGSQVTLLCHLERLSDEYPHYHNYWVMLESIALSVEPFPADEAEEVQS